MQNLSAKIARLTVFTAALSALLAVAVAAKRHESAALPDPSPTISNPPTAAPQEKFGTIKGRLVWGGAKAPEPQKVPASSTAKDPVCSKSEIYDRELVVDPETLGVAQAFAYLPNPKGKNPEAEKALLEEHPRVEIDQIDCQYVPFSSAGMAKQEWVFNSSDATGHNVHYTGFTNNGNFSLPPEGEAVKKLNPEKRPINLVCDIHPWMKGNMMVFNHPFFAVTGEDGSFEISGVPAGTQKIVLWQRKSGYVTSGGATGMEVVVKAGEVTDLGEIKLDPAKIK